MICHCFVDQNLRFHSVAGKTGILEAYETPSELNWDEFLRFRVQIDISKPLLKGLKIKMGGVQMWVPLTYESLPFLCFQCGKLVTCLSLVHCLIEIGIPTWNSIHQSKRHRFEDPEI